MLADETFTVRWLKAVKARHQQAKVLFWWPFWTIVTLLAIAVLLDAPMLTALENWPRSEREFFDVLTDLGKSDWLLFPTLIGIIVGAIAMRLKLSYSWAWAVRGVFFISAYVFTTIAFSGIVVQIFKRLIGRARPMYLEELGVLHFEPFSTHWSFHSFPSGHATTAIAFALLVHTMVNRRFGGWIIAFGFFVGLSRIVVGDHFLSDVLAGSFVGLASAILVRDFFLTRHWGMRMEDGKINYRMFSAFGPILRRFRRRGRKDAEVTVEAG